MNVSRGGVDAVVLPASELWSQLWTQPSVAASPFLQPALLRAPALRGTATFAQALQNVPETQVSLLDNGLRVASEQSPQQTCTVSRWSGRLGLHLGRGVTLGLSPPVCGLAGSG